MQQSIGPRLIASLPRLRRYALALSRVPDTADDLVQAACERALASASDLRDDLRFEPWLFRILRNVWLDRLRRLGTQRTEPDTDATLQVPVPDAEHLPERRILLRKAMSAIDALPAEQRELMLLVCVEGLSYREAADVLDLPIGTVMSRLARARRKVADDVGVETGRVL